VKQEQQAIDAQFEKKRKGAETAQKMWVFFSSLIPLPYVFNTKNPNTTCFDSHQSTLTNKSRLRLLHRREEQLQDLFAAARTQIARLADDEARYVQFLESVIVQGLLQLLEPSATVYARSKDEAIAGRALDGAKKTYHDISGRQVEIDLDASLSNDL
jgi:V-type H+-transporting ATPase subunit E